MFNRDQWKGLAKVLDTVGSALLIALALDVVVDQSLGWLQAVALGILGVGCLGASYALRKGD
jgi:hypothetical protein